MLNEAHHLSNRLTPTQQRFVDARKAGATKTEAAIKAGLSAKTACAAGSRLAKHPLVMAALPKMAVVLRPRKVPAKPKAKALTQPPPQQTDSAPPADRAPYLYEDPKEYLRFVMNDIEANPRLRNEAAKALLSVETKKPADVGKKAARNEAAKNVAGRFSAGAPPKLVAAGGRKV